MNIFLRLLNSLRFRKIEELGEVQNNNFQKAISRSRKLHVLKNGKILQKDIGDVFGTFGKEDEGFKSSELFVVRDHEDRLFIYDYSGKCLTPNSLAYMNYGKDVLIGKKIEGTPLTRVYDSRKDQYFYISDNPIISELDFENYGKTRFITENYVNFEEFADRIKVVSANTNALGQRATYFLDRNGLPCSVKFVSEGEMDENGNIPLELYNENTDEAKYVLSDINYMPLTKEFAGLETFRGHYLAEDENGDVRFIDKKGRNRSHTIDQAIVMENGNILIKRKRSSYWDIQRLDNLKYVVKDLKNVIYHPETGTAFATYEGTPVVFGYNPLEMHKVDGNTGRLIYNLLNKTRMGSKFIDKVLSHPETVDHTLATVKSVMKENLEKAPSNVYLKRLTGDTNKSLDSRFLTRLVNINKNRAYRDNKAIFDFERQMAELEKQIVEIERKIKALGEELSRVRAKHGETSERYQNTLVLKQKFEAKLEKLRRTLTTTMTENFEELNIDPTTIELPEEVKAEDNEEEPEVEEVEEIEKENE